MLTPWTRIDLTVANKVHIVEPHWNPMVEAQAIDRIHRMGQLQDVEVVRYIVTNSIETVILWLQKHGTTKEPMLTAMRASTFNGFRYTSSD